MAALGDPAYLSRMICNLVDKSDRKPFIKSKSNTITRSKGSPSWREMVLMYQNDEKKFRDTHHARSRVESTFAAFKKHFGSSVNARKVRMQDRVIALRVLWLQHIPRIESS